MKTILKRFFLFIGLIIIAAAAYFFYLKHNSEVISTGNLIPQYGTVKSAILIIDIQEATTGKISQTEPYIRQSGSLIKNVNALIDYSTKKNIPVIYIYTETDNWFINLLNDTMEKGSLGTKLDSRLNVVSENVLSKEKNDSFSNPKLDELLLRNKIGKIYFTGLDPAYCINNTLLAAKNRGYKLSIIEDAVISESDSLKNEMLKKFKMNGVQVITESDYLKSAEL